MNRIRGTKIEFTANEPITTQEQINQCFRDYGIGGTLEGIRQIITALEGRNGVDQEQLNQASGLVNDAEQRWQEILEIKRVLESSLELSSNEQWLQKVSKQPSLKRSLETIFAPEVRTVHLKNLLEELTHRTVNAFNIVCAESAEEGFSTSDIGKGFKKRQSNNAKKLRNPYLKELITKLAKRRDMTNKELWSKLIAMMDDSFMEPEETGNSKQPSTWVVNYTTDKGEKKLKFSTFKTYLWEARK